ncbi:MAG: STAS domain-containing protein [Anaerolineae bacterium]|jgi:anti-sigma B factor antagonist|uniref:STAS domain-containing protein n=1 Tax=Candidatus Amarolinea dominans TaxID=3140696 RepID=UPI001D4CF938|nr:STAS domain-containing protein [Anaerolineae bacterium]MBK7199707.1 STAS domain-containing protein [Anaerolineae bacterium]MBK9091237.1 STAS domain-containing protein [Anaerolineae bacterium]
MEITSSELKRCVLVNINGRIDGSSAPEMEQALKALMDSGHYRLVLDIGGVTFLSSAGIRVLVSTWKTVRRFNRGDLRLANVPPRISEVLDLTGLNDHFAQFSSNVEAVGSF